MCEAMAWAEEEFGGAVLGDAQLTKRLVRLADELSSNPAKSTPVACGGEGGVPVAGQRGAGVAGRKGDGHPDPKALWEGLLKLMAYIEAFQAARDVYGAG